jgi:hypothetical protein
VGVFLGVVGTVADDNFSDREVDEIDRDLDLPPPLLVEQETIDPALAHLGFGEGDRTAGIDDAVDEQHRLAGKGSREYGRGAARHRCSLWQARSC